MESARSTNRQGTPTADDLILANSALASSTCFVISSTSCWSLSFFPAIVRMSLGITISRAKHQTISVFKVLIRFSKVIYEVEPDAISTIEVLKGQGPMVVGIVKLFWYAIRVLQGRVSTCQIVFTELEGHVSGNRWQETVVNRGLCTFQRANVKHQGGMATSASLQGQQATYYQFDGRRDNAELSGQERIGLQSEHWD